MGEYTNKDKSTIAGIPFLFYFLFVFQVQGQNAPLPTSFRDYFIPAAKLDSLKKIEKYTPPNTHSSQYLHLMIAIEFGKQNVYDTINKQKVKQLIPLASNQKSQLALAMVYYILGREYTIYQEDSLSYSYLTKAEQIFTTNRDTTGIIHCSKLLRAHTRRADSNLSKHYFNRVVTLGQQSNHPIDNYMYYLLVMACDPYFETQPTEGQIAKTLQKTLKIIDKYPHFEYIRVNVYKTIQEGYLRKKRYDKVLEFALKVMYDTNKKIDFMDYQYLGNAYLSVKKYDKAIWALEEAAKRIEVERPNSLMRQRNIYIFLKKAYYEAGNLEGSIRADAKYDSLLNLITSNDRSLAVFHLREKYSFAEKEAELKRLVLENEVVESQKRLLFGGLIMALLLLGSVLFFSLKLRKVNTQLLELQQARDKFYTIIAHDLRSPLNTLHDIGTLLRHLIREGEKKELDRAIQQIETMAHQANLLLNNLFEYGKNHYFPNEVMLQHNQFEVVGLLQMLYQYYLPFAEAKGVVLSTVFPDSLILKTNQQGLEMLVRNLLDNALKHTPSGGKITISCSTQQSKKGIVLHHAISISDTGEGIAPEQLHYLQQIFAGKITPVVGMKGLGLGIVLIHDFIQKNNISLAISSQLGKGTEVILNLIANSDINR